MPSVTDKGQMGRVRRGRALAKRVRVIRNDTLEDAVTDCMVSMVPSSAGGWYIVVIWMECVGLVPRLFDHKCGCLDHGSEDAVVTENCKGACKHVIAACLKYIEEF